MQENCLTQLNSTVKVLFVCKFREVFYAANCKTKTFCQFKFLCEWQEKDRNTFQFKRSQDGKIENMIR